eukprot:m.125814 g.125814  ORF g.125814 m.125814 type:complete len:109 (-) comp15760_c0_seq3:3642-3968(-)
MMDKQAGATKKKKTGKKKRNKGAKPKSKKQSNEADVEVSNPLAEQLALLDKYADDSSLRWEHAWEDESEEIAAYKAARRARYVQHKEAMLEKAKMVAQQPSQFSLTPR